MTFYESTRTPGLKLWSVCNDRTPRVLLHDPRTPAGRPSNYETASGVLSQLPEPVQISPARAREIMGAWAQEVAA